MSSARPRNDPRIEKRDAKKLEIGDITRHDRKTVNDCRRGDQGVTFGARIGNVKTRAALHHRGIDGKDAAIEPARIPSIQARSTAPCAASLRRIGALPVRFPGSKRRKEKSSPRNRVQPRQRHCDPRSGRLKFGDNVGVQQEHQPRSAALYQAANAGRLEFEVVGGGLGQGPRRGSAGAPGEPVIISIVKSTCAGCPRSVMKTGPRRAAFFAPLVS